MMPTDPLADETLIDQIYEAALIPSKWIGVLDALGNTVGAAGSFLSILSESGTTGALWSDGIHDLCTQWIAGGWQERTQRAPRMMALDHPGFIADCDVYGPGELELDESYSQILRPMGFGQGAGTGIRMPTGDLAIFSIERRYTTGPFTREHCLELDAFRPHLARATLLACKLGLERAHQVTDALGTVGLPSAVLRHSGRILAANNLFETLIPLTFQDGRDRLRISAKDADDLLADSIARLQAGNYHGVGSIPLRATEVRPPLVVHLLPFRREANDLIASGAALLIATPIDRQRVPSATVLQGLFDLTPAESKVAREILEAKTIEQMSVVLGVKQETVRSQIKAVLAKTGARRQQELISMLAGKWFAP